MGIRHFRYLVLSLTVGGFTSVPNGSADKTPVKTESIKKTWSARQSRFLSVDCSYKSRCHQLTTVSMPLEEQIERAKRGQKAVDYINYTSTTRMLVEGGRVRYEIRGKLPSEKGALYEHDSVDACNGKVSKTLNNKGNNLRYRTGFIYRGLANRCANLVDPLPVLWTFLSPDPKTHGFDFDKLEFSAKGTIDGRECLIFKNKLSVQQTEFFWFDPNMDYSILRCTVETDGKVESQLDCSYKNDSSGLWLPVKWTTTHFNDYSSGQIRTSGDNQVEFCKLNVRVLDLDFDIVFPPGTFVSDERPQPGVGRTGTLDYIVMSDGSKRIVTWEERFASYEELLATPSGKAGLQTGSAQRHYWLFVSPVLLLATLIILMFLRRKAHRKS